MAVLILYIAIFTVLGCEFAMIAEIQQRVHIVVHPENHVTAPAAVTAGWAALGYKFLATEGGLAMAARACRNLDSNSVNKLHTLPPSKSDDV